MAASNCSSGSRLINGFGAPFADFAAPRARRVPTVVSDISEILAAPPSRRQHHSWIADNAWKTQTHFDLDAAVIAGPETKPMEVLSVLLFV
jgi:hypothetical protein